MDELHKLSTPSLSNEQTTRRENPRSRGINFNAVNPIALKTSRSYERSWMAASSTPITHLQYDFVLPLNEMLHGLDIDQQLRLLAMKEMTVVEIRDGMANLKTKLDQTERDLGQLREVIQRSLYKEMHRPQKWKSFNTAHHKDFQDSQKDTMQNSTHSEDRKQQRKRPEKIGRVSRDNTTPEPSNIWSNLARPMNFIQHLDTMLLHEFERSLASSQANKETSTVKDQSNTSYTAVSDDMFQAVSSSLWSFVNDVKINMLSTLNEPGLESSTTGLGNESISRKSGTQHEKSLESALISIRGETPGKDAGHQHFDKTSDRRPEKRLSEDSIVSSKAEKGKQSKGKSDIEKSATGKTRYTKRPEGKSDTSFKSIEEDVLVPAQFDLVIFEAQK